MSSTTPRTILFLGATGGCGLSALRRSLAAGHTCIALCRTPSKLQGLIPDSNKLRGKLILEQGNALDVDSVSRCLRRPPSSTTNSSEQTPLVDFVVFSVGGAFVWSKLTLDDMTVCQSSMAALLKAIEQNRGSGPGPHVVAVSTTGLSTAGRDVPLLFVPFYHVVLKVPHEDKVAMERVLMRSGERFTIVRPSLLTSGPETEAKVRVGVEDPIAEKVESRARGYFISREDVGKWIFENVIQAPDGGRKWNAKVATITY